MKENKDENVEELAQELESRISRKTEEEELQEIVFEDSQEELFPEEDISEIIWEEDLSEEKNQNERLEKGTLDRISGEVRRTHHTKTKENKKENLEEDWEEEDIAPVKPWVMAVAMAGIIVLAAIICAILWHFTHLEQKEEEQLSQSPVAAENSAMSPAGADDSSGNTPEDASASVPSPETTAPLESEPVSTASPTPTVSPTASPAPTATPEPTVPQTTLPPSTAVQEPVSGTTAMEFTQSNAEVTPKDVINLRSEPSTLNADNIVAQAKNGDILNRTGVNEATGWTRIDYNGETLYAVSQYLTTDLTYKTPVQAANPNRVNTLDGRIILFTDCSDNITPKEYVNLRTEPSTSEGDSTVRCQISNGEVVHRTGYSPDAGWSRVEYNGEILYVVSSYMYTVE